MVTPPSDSRDPSRKFKVYKDTVEVLVAPHDENTDKEGAKSEQYPETGKKRGFKDLAWIVFYHLKKHTGVGLVCAVAYFDPGNWGVDLLAGSQYGYRLLFIVLLCGLFAILIQCLATRLGVVTGLDLASHCRVLLHSRPKHTLLYRWLALYPLYAISEIGIIATDLAELLGSAIALCLLFPNLQLWHGVLITAFDVIFVLALGDPLRGRPVKYFEIMIGAMVLAVLICMCIIIAKVDVQWGDTFIGYLPSKYIIPNGALYTSVGILGATVMPHSIFLGSALATQDRVSLPNVAVVDENRSERENNTAEHIKKHLYHGIIDMAVSLLGFAVVINSLILILAAAVFFYGQNNGSSAEGPAGLFEAYDLIKELIGQSAATVFAIALLAAGQSSSIIATVAGQAVSEGFLQWRTSPVVRRLVTRLIAVIPSMAVAIAMGKPGIDALLVASQVVLSIVLPFITAPLIYLTASKKIMRARKPQFAVYSEGTSAAEMYKQDVETAESQGEDFSSNRFTTAVATCIWVLITMANIYVLVTLGMGEGD
ncbi:putative transporter of the NRAMP family [Dendrothele bispora CBS 962.96]|uniref:Putative transporter of the NRAMP family n=1 Tax=Dendrothele bispora (strain CBS 962.96) TaxID=1314807 RepID=A0A4S8L9I8_DENBC|nr:putative transporter of the NRAMP family [Dendrothele bispora CBS 962.96]